MVLVEIDPADVVSIPTDCEFQKLRTCRYKVVAECERPLDELVYESRFSTENDDDVEEEWDDSVSFSVCSDCGRNWILCVECDYCSDCCECDDDDEDCCMADPDEPEQLTLPLDNKMQSIEWTKQWIALDTLISHLFATRRPALAMTIRRYGAGDLNPVQYGVLLDFTTQADAKTIYNELNP
jgi:hypothetical protein